MRQLISFLSVPLIVAAGATMAQERNASERAPLTAQFALKAGEETSEEIRARGRAWFAQCMADWDMATHMSKVEWKRTCQRVALERTKFLMEKKDNK